jgi:hypothetical protein
VDAAHQIVNSKTPSIMKTLAFLAAALFIAPVAFGQGEALGTIKATTKLRRDGTRTTAILDPDKRTREETLTDAAGKILKKTIFMLDDRNFATAAIHYDAKGNVRYKETYTRDGSDRVSESHLFSKDDRPLGKRVFHYDDRGNAQKIDDYDASGNLIVPPQPVKPGRPDKKRR